MQSENQDEAIFMHEKIFNPASFLRKNTETFSQKMAIIAPNGNQLTYAELDTRSDQFARILQQAGVGAGCKTILLVPPGLDLYILIFAFFKIGAVPIVVDPGMGIKRVLHCYQSVAAESFVGITTAHLIRIVTPQFFQNVKSILWLHHGKLTITKKNSPSFIPDKAYIPVPIVQNTLQQLAMINFTTGSTGPAKPVMATYGMTIAMISLLRDHFSLTHEDRELVTLPLLGVVALCVGCTIVIADMHPGKPAKASPKKIIDAILHYRITSMFVSPALLERIEKYATFHHITLPDLRCVNSGGAPVAAATLARFQQLLSGQGRLHVTYGATEGLPLASITAETLLSDTKTLIQNGKGTPLGYPVGDVEIRIISITHKPLSRWHNSLLAAPGEVGEIVVWGANVSQAYYELPEANIAFKIPEESGTETLIWHRTGDLAWRDHDGRIIFCGRLSHLVQMGKNEILFSVACEGVSNAHPEVRRSALVGVNLNAMIQPVMCIELNVPVSRKKKQQIQQEIHTLLSQNTITKNIHTILFHHRFPVDIRHNAKIERAKLAVWAHKILTQTSAEKKKAHAFKLIPILGWIYILFGLIVPLPNGFWLWCWYIDLFLSIVVHICQIPLGISIGKLHGYSALKSAFQTFLFGAVWWKPLQLLVNKERMK